MRVPSIGKNCSPNSLRCLFTDYLIVDNAIDIRATRNRKYSRVKTKLFIAIAPSSPQTSASVHTVTGKSIIVLKIPLLVPSPIGLGIESGAIPDSQFTSTSQLSLEYGAQFSRLNSRTGGGAWCAASCDPSVYLQIDLGRVLLIREVRRCIKNFRFILELSLS